MEIINLRMHQMRSLKELKLEEGVLNTEAYMLILSKRYAKGKNGETLVLKYLDAQDDEKAMARKLYTVNMLNGSEVYKSIEELIIPQFAVSVDSKMAAFAMPLIENHRNLGVLLNNKSIPLSKKLPFMKKLCKLVSKVQGVEEESFRMQFGDLNEFNFIINEDDELRAVDLDSAYVGQDEPSNMAYYLLKNKYIADLKEKYRCTKNGIVIPTDNSDLYCLNMIIMDSIAKQSMYNQDLAIYYSYLSYLKDIGFDKDLIKVFQSIYLPIDNINPKGLIDTIDPNLEEAASFKVFQKEYK